MTISQPSRGDKRYGEVYSANDIASHYHNNPTFGRWPAGITPPPDTDSDPYILSQAAPAISVTAASQHYLADYQ